MKGRVIALGPFGATTAAALAIDGRLADLFVDAPDDGAPRFGAICRARAGRPMKGQGGMFVDLPGGATGFLRQTGGIAPGQNLIVQVGAVAEAGKAPVVSPRPVIRGRAIVATPGAPGVNVARTIRDAERAEALRAVGEGALAGRATIGLILRSAAADMDDDAIAAEARDLADLADRIWSDTRGAPELLLDAPDAAARALANWSDPAPDAVEEGEGAFARAGVAEAIQSLRAARVVLGAGHLWVEPTRAVIGIDVNTGGDASPAAGLKANLAAAAEIPAQLRLRGLGGQVVVDFAPMPRADRKKVEMALARALKADGAEVQIVGWTGMGLFEMTRKRDRHAWTLDPMP